MSNIQLGKIGEISRRVTNILDLSIAPGTPIYIGKSNIKHMRKKHQEDYIK